MTQISFDLETYSACDLKASGAWVYAEHPSTEVLCMAYAVDGGEPVLWVPDPLEPLSNAPRWLTDLASGRYRVRAWNVGFEYAILLYTLKVDPGPIECWDDTMAEARAVALPGGLDACGRAMRMPLDLQKDARGSLLIQRLCKPNRAGVPYDKPDRAELLDELYAYCVQDVIAERAIARLLPRLPAHERLVWETDQAINFAGVPIDVESCRHALVMYERLKDDMDGELRELTGIDNPNSVKQMKVWLADQGVVVANLQNATLAALLDEDTRRSEAAGEWDEPWLPDGVRLAIGLLQDRKRSPITKYAGLLARTNSDGRLRGTHLYHKASTGRWASVGVNTQNMARPAYALAKGNRANETIADFPERDPYALAQRHGASPVDILSSAIRGMIRASTGHRFIISDFDSIEARITAYLADQPGLLRTFRGDGRVYEAQAAAMFGKPVDAIAKDSPERFIGKVAVLACGFAGGAGAFLSMGAQYGIDDITEHEAQRYVDLYRAANPEICALWVELEGACHRAIRHKGTVFSAARGLLKVLCMATKPEHLKIRLPSGRCLHYWYPALVAGKFAGSHDIEYSGAVNERGGWGRVRAWRGTLIENVVQGIARDLLASGMLRLRAAGYPIVLHVHDEVVCEVPHGQGSVEAVNALLCETPAWFPDFPLSAEGYESERYRK